MIVSNDGANRTAALLGRGVVTVVPVTSNTEVVHPFQVVLAAASTGLSLDSKAQAEQIRSVDVRRIGSLVGMVPFDLMAQIDDAMAPAPRTLTASRGLIFVGGPVHTMGSPATVEAVRVDGRRITAVGGLAELGACARGRGPGDTTAGVRGIHDRRGAGAATNRHGRHRPRHVGRLRDSAVATDRLPDVAVDQTWVAGRKAWPSDGTATC